MEFKVGDKVKMNRKSQYFREMENGISLSWWLALEENEPLTIVGMEGYEYGLTILTTDYNGLRVAELWVLPYEEGS